MFSRSVARPPGRATLGFTIGRSAKDISRSGPPLSSHYPAILVAAILSALLAPIWVGSLSAFISSRRLSACRVDRPTHKGAAARHLIVFDRLSRRNQTCIDGDAPPETLDRFLTPHPRRRCHSSPGRAWPAAASLDFEHLFKTLDMALCLFAVCHERLCKLRHLRRLGYLGKSPENLLFRSVNILQLRQNRSLTVFSTTGISF
jgi:hypothetical protein